MSSTMFAMKASAEAGSAEQKRAQEKRRNILVLVNQYLIESGYVGAAEGLQKEAGMVLSRFEVADNIDMGLILSDYESYYEMRFDKKPKLVRKLKDGEENLKGFASKGGKGGGSNKGGRKPESLRKEVNGVNAPPPQTPTSQYGAIAFAGSDKDKNDTSEQMQNNNVNDGNGLSVVGVKEAPQARNKVPETDNAWEKLENRVLKPPPQFGGDMEMKQLAGIISNEIYQESTNVTFNDIVALDEAKRLLCEAVQLPLKFPFLFSGLLRPWKGILLHGPPGTGKTLLARAVATECNTTFFNISASTLVSKWRGDSEKLVRCLFELARYHSPSTVFLDEIDSILGSRGGGGDGAGAEHEASRRMKTELLIQMDGMGGSKTSEHVFVMAASNLPWDLDTALLRRLEKRVLVPLPVAEARVTMLKKHLQDRVGEDSVDFELVANRMEGYSGADLELVCREAAMRPVRRLMQKITSLENSSPEKTPKDGSSASIRSKVSAKVGSMGGFGVTSTVTAEEVDSLLKSDPVSNDDILASLETTRPSSDGKMVKYQAWQKEFGAV